jgi:hypothetical protein
VGARHRRQPMMLTKETLWPQTRRAPLPPPPRGGRLSDLSWRSEVLVYAVTLLLLLWPLAVNGAPFYSPDSASYLRGGGFGFHTGLVILGDWWRSLVGGTREAAGASPQAIVAEAIAKSGGARSAIYSVATYLLRWPGNSLTALAIAQAGTVALILSCLGRLIAPQSGIWPRLAVGAGIALLTPAAWYAAYVVPDILAGVAIAGAVVLTIFFERISVALRVVLVLLLAFCIAAHASHLLMTASALAAGAVAHFRMHRPTIGRTVWFASPVILAVAAMLGTSYAAFGEASLAPKRYPIQLARSVADGPAYWHLRNHCGSEHYAICELYGTNPPRDAGDFLWGPNGVRYRASPEQMERIRAEESTIVRRAAMEYPWVQLRRSVTNAFLQVFQFGPKELVFGVRLTGERPDLTQVHADRPALKASGKALMYLSFFGSVLLLIVLRRRLTPAEKAAVLVAAIGLLANAAVCGAFSAVTDRYQARVVWIVPALAFFIAARLWSARSKPA